MKDAYKLTEEKLFKTLETGHRGLDKSKVLEIRNVYGKNELTKRKKRSKIEIFLDQFKNIMVILLIIVGILSLINSIVTHDSMLEAFVILGTSLINCFMGFVQESKAEDGINKLNKYYNDYCIVKRNGKYQKVNSKNLVVGDYIVLEAGDKVPADARIIDSFFGKVDESILTGESINVDKEEGVIEKDVPLSERTNMIYSGTSLVSGKIEAIIVATGMNTELGKIASSIDKEEKEITPLEIKVQKISKFITLIASILVMFAIIFGIVKGFKFLDIVILCVSLIIASVPESLPIAITATLSIGVKEMAKKKSIVRNLVAIETLGAAEVICTDKTGTLTENKMQVIKLYDEKGLIEERTNKELLEIMYYANTAALNNRGKLEGDSVDIALKEYIKNNNYTIPKAKKIIELPFDSDRKLMSTVYEKDGKIIMYTKGSLEALSKKSIGNNKYKSLETKMSNEALKVIAFGYKELKGKCEKEKDYLSEENNFHLIGIVGLKDPVRKNITDSINECKRAHIRPIMLTGDNLETAYAIAKETGICNSKEEVINAHDLDNLNSKQLKEIVKKYNVFSRVSPKNKLDIIKALQESGKVIAMSGDGVNDAPAIKLANIGIGMGKSGTDVTKSVSDIILLDDSYNTIITAVKEGRRIYDNVISNILYNLSSNFTEIFIILFGMLTGNTMISALHILYIDLVADTIPSITMAFEEASSDVMHRKPNGLNQKIFTKNFTLFLLASVVIETSICIYVYYHFLPLGSGIAQTLTLLSIILNEFVFAFNCRSIREQIHKRGVFTNKYMNIGIFFLLLIQFLVFFTPIGKLFSLSIISVGQFMFILFINILSFVLIELTKPIIKRYSN